MHNFAANTGSFFFFCRGPHTHSYNIIPRCAATNPAVAFYLLTTILLPQLSIQYRERLPAHFTHFRTSINIHKMYDFLSRDRETRRPGRKFHSDPARCVSLWIKSCRRFEGKRSRFDDPRVPRARVSSSWNRRESDTRSVSRSKLRSKIFTDERARFQIIRLPVIPCSARGDDVNIWRRCYGTMVSMGQSLRRKCTRVNIRGALNI